MMCKSLAEMEHLTNSIQRANDVINQIYVCIEKETELRGLAIKSREALIQKTKQYRKEQVLIPILLFGPLVMFNLIIPLIFFSTLTGLADVFEWTVLADKIENIGDICIDFLMDPITIGNISIPGVVLPALIESILICVLIFIKHCGDNRSYIGEATQYEQAADLKHEEAMIIAEKNADYLAIIPQKYRYPLASNFIEELFQLGRATTLPEAYDKLEEQLYRWNMENAMGQLINVQIENMKILEDIDLNTYWF